MLEAVLRYIGTGMMLGLQGEMKLRAERSVAQY